MPTHHVSHIPLHSPLHPNSLGCFCVAPNRHPLMLSTASVCPPFITGESTPSLTIQSSQVTIGFIRPLYCIPLPPKSSSLPKPPLPPSHRRAIIPPTRCQGPRQPWPRLEHTTATLLFPKHGTSRHCFIEAIRISRKRAKRTAIPASPRGGIRRSNGSDLSAPPPRGGIRRSSIPPLQYPRRPGPSPPSLSYFFRATHLFDFLFSSPSRRQHHQHHQQPAASELRRQKDRRACQIPRPGPARHKGPELRCWHKFPGNALKSSTQCPRRALPGNLCVESSTWKLMR